MPSGRRHRERQIRLMTKSHKSQSEKRVARARATRTAALGAAARRMKRRARSASTDASRNSLRVTQCVAARRAALRSAPVASGATWPRCCTTEHSAAQVLQKALAHKDTVRFVSPPPPPSVHSRHAVWDRCHHKTNLIWTRGRVGTVGHAVGGRVGTHLTNARAPHAGTALS